MDKGERLLLLEQNYNKLWNSILLKLTSDVVIFRKDAVLAVDIPKSDENMKKLLDERIVKEGETGGKNDFIMTMSGIKSEIGAWVGSIEKLVTIELMPQDKFAPALQNMMDPPGKQTVTLNALRSKRNAIVEKLTELENKGNTNGKNYKKLCKDLTLNEAEFQKEHMAWVEKSLAVFNRVNYWVHKNAVNIIQACSVYMYLEHYLTRMVTGAKVIAVSDLSLEILLVFNMVTKLQYSDEWKLFQYLKNGLYLTHENFFGPYCVADEELSDKKKQENSNKKVDNGQVQGAAQTTTEDAKVEHKEEELPSDDKSQPSVANEVPRDDAVVITTADQ